MMSPARAATPGRVPRIACLALCCAALGTLTQGGAASPGQGAEAVERAYRENNVGVAWMEQFSYPQAAAHFEEAVRLQPGLGIARFNLALAHFYGGQVDAARREARAAAEHLPDAAQPAYLEGLIARHDNRPAEAIAAFSRALRAAPADVGANVGIGQARLQAGDAAGAVSAFEAAAAAEPYNATATFGLATSLSRVGRDDEGRQALARLQALRQSGKATSFRHAYLEQGRLAEVMLSTGLEPELVDAAMPEVRFVEMSLDGGAASPDRAHSRAGGITLVDADRDGAMDLLEATSDGLRLWKNDGRGNLRPDPPAFASSPTARGIGAVAGDLDGDGSPDVLVLAEQGVTLHRNDGRGRFTDVTKAAGLAGENVACRAAALADLDHDGDLDIVLAAGSAAAARGDAAPPVRLLRNDGSGVFTEVGAASGLAGARVIGIVPTDYDERRDVDLLIVASDARPALFRNMRDGTFAEQATGAQLPSETAWSAVAAGDVNKDGRTDFFLGRPAASGLLALSAGGERFTVQDAPAATAGAHAALLLDYDNDGLLDILAVSANSARLLRNVGSGWSDASLALPVGRDMKIDPPSMARGLAAADMDGDGDTDVVLRTATGVHLWRNDGGNRLPSLAVRLTARVSNRSAVGAQVEMRAGSLRDRRETSAVSPAVGPSDVTFGLGRGRQADAVRILWPSGALQAELPDPGASALSLTEADRKPSSCPLLFTWNGDRFEFVTDFLGGGEIGYWQAPGQRNTPDPDEYVRIPESALRPRDGRFEIRITNELEEALFLDSVRLHVVDHAAGTEVYPVEGLHASPRPGLRLVTVRDAAAPAAVVDDHGRNWLGHIDRLDYRAPEFALARVRGYAWPHSLEITAPAEGAHDVLLLTGWTDYAFSSDNVAASQAGLVLAPPRLEARDERGGWIDTGLEVGVPGGRPQTLVVDLSRLPRVAGQAFRITTTMRIYWDRVRFGQQVRGGRAAVELGPASRAVLWRRGFSKALPSGPGGLLLYDYQRVSSTSPWKQLTGRYTEEGDVNALLLRADDDFVVAAPGDAVALDFDATRAGTSPAGLERTYLLEAHGFSKEMDLHSASPDELGPLPYRAMVAYPASGGPRRSVGSSWRAVTRGIPLIESLLIDPPPRR